jgi:hypothetical protein
VKCSVDIALLPSEAADPQRLRARALAEAGVDPRSEDVVVRTVRRSIDGRSRTPRIRLQIEVFVGEEPPVLPQIVDSLRDADPNRRVVIVGAGPAGYFAALELLRSGLTPIVLERGKDVRTRRRDLKALQQEGVVNEHSNYCFGEGGAGTYSDGKLYTRSHKRGSIDEVLRLFVEHGATPEILVDTHPHIGSNKLWAVVQRMRETIQQHGGEVRFDTHVTELILDKGVARGVRTAAGDEVTGEAVVLATGHSARDVFRMLLRQGVRIEAKPFALGVRIEHAQQIVDQAQYHQLTRDPALPASSYRLACQVSDHGVFSFCMCPGGLIVPSSTEPGEVVVNGMSMSRRDSPYANSGTVVSVDAKDWAEYEHHGVLAAMEYQAASERAAFEHVHDGTQRAPAQRMVDFVKGRVSRDLPATSYIPGLQSVDLRSVLPAVITENLSRAVQEFGRTMRGYYTNEAVLVGVESRTSSPVRIPRDRETYEHVDVKRLYPAAEGAGYAGGIVSAALDGQNIARAIARVLAVLLLMIGVSMQAQDSHYWTNQFGTESWLLGGSVVGHSSDLSSTYYNPGALPIHADTISFQTAISLNWSRTSVGGSDQSFEMVSTMSTPLPAFVGVNVPVSLLGSKALQISYLQRTNVRLEMSGIAYTDPADSIDGVAVGSIYRQLYDSWFGITWSKLYGKKHGLGVTTFASAVTSEYNSQFTGGSLSSAIATMASVSRYVSYDNFRLLAKLGYYYDGRPFTFGVTLTTPSVKLFNTYGEVRIALLEQSDTSSPVLAGDKQRGLEATYRTPLSIAAGSAWYAGPTSWFLTLEWFAPLDAYQPVESAPFIAQEPTVIGDHSFVVKRNGVLNVVVGMRHTFNKELALYASIMRDGTSQSTSDNAADAIVNYDLYHGTVGFQYVGKSLSLTLGGIIGGGWARDVSPPELGESNIVMDGALVDKSFLRLGFLLGLVARI